MGMLKSKTNKQGVSVSGVTLGFPTIVREDGQPSQSGDVVADLWFGWSDSRLVDGTIDADGTITTTP